MVAFAVLMNAVVATAFGAFMLAFPDGHELMGPLRDSCRKAGVCGAAAPFGNVSNIRKRKKKKEKKRKKRKRGGGGEKHR